MVKRDLFRQRLMILLAICCGALAVGLFYRGLRAKSVAVGTDAQAQSVGFSSSADQVATEAAFNAYWPDILGHGRLSAWEYDLAVKTLEHGSRAAKLRMIIVMGYLRGDAERKRALALMPRGEIDPSLFAIWGQCFRRWMKISPPANRRGVLALLKASGNPNALKLATELE